MTKEERIQKAKDLFSSGYNCSQSVVLAYGDVLGFDADTLELFSAPFGGGIGRLREVCGAVSGMMMVISLSVKKNTLDKTQKMELYALEQEAAAKFKEQAGSIVCRELMETRAAHGDVPNCQKLGCRDLVGLAVSVFEDMNVVK